MDREWNREGMGIRNREGNGNGNGNGNRAEWRVENGGDREWEGIGMEWENRGIGNGGHTPRGRGMLTLAANTPRGMGLYP